MGHGDEDVLAAPRVEVRERPHPELRAFGVPDPQAEDVAGPSGRIASAREIALLRTTASSRILTRRASKKTRGYTASSGRLCHAVTTATMLSVTVLIRSGRPRPRTSPRGSPESLARHPACVERQDLVVEAGEPCTGRSTPEDPATTQATSTIHSRLSTTHPATACPEPDPGPDVRASANHHPLSTIHHPLSTSHQPPPWPPVRPSGQDAQASAQPRSTNHHPPSTIHHPPTSFSATLNPC